jgi:haloalkane dehalogenase
MNDPFLADDLPAMRELFPNAQVTETNAGHFLQEEGDSPQAIAAAIERVREQIDP